MKQFILGISTILLTMTGFSQDCPVAFTRNNGNTAGACASHIKLDFTSCPTSTPVLDSIKINGVLEPETFSVYQTKCAGSNNYVDYCISDNNLPPAAQITVYLTFPGATPSQNTSLVCNVASASGGPTPIILSAFNLQKKNNQVLLTWQTQQEINSSAFEVERSSDGTNFQSIGKVPAAGNSGVVLNYSFADETNVSSGASFYRIKMVDIDGAFSYSATKTIDNSDISASFAVYPNPVAAGEKITINNLTGPSTIKVFDLSGRMLNYYNVNDNRQAQISIKQTGTYLIQITDRASGATQVRKLSVVN